MKIKLSLWRPGSTRFTKIYDHNSVVKTNNGDKLMKELSLNDDQIIIDGKEYNIIHMYIYKGD